MRKTEKTAMAQLFQQSGLTLTGTQIDQFGSYYSLLQKHNDELDLTRLNRFEDIVIKHFIDCALVTRLCDLPSPLVDIGTGAGFPGIPLKIMKPDLRLILAEPRKKRAAFLAETVAALNLGNVEIYPHMVTEHSVFDVGGVITRALESVDDTLGRVAHFLPRGGRVIFMKGPAADEDIRKISPSHDADYEIELDRDYTLPGTQFGRRLLIFTKTSSARKTTYRILSQAGETPGIPISSPENATFREMKKLISSDGIKKIGKTLVSGKKQVHETITRHPGLCEALALFDGYAETDSGMNDCIGSFQRNRRLYIVKKSLFNEIDIFNTNGPVLEARTPEIPEWDRTAGEGCTLLIPFQDPSNVGTVIRSAVGFGVQHIVLLREAAHPFHPKSIRASGGAVFAARLSRGPSLAEFAQSVKEGNAPLLALDSGGAPIDGFVFPERFLLLAGIEGPGIPDTLKVNALSIPMSGDVESLNAAIAASIALYTWKASRRGPR